MAQWPAAAAAESEPPCADEDDGREEIALRESSSCSCASQCLAAGFSPSQQRAVGSDFAAAGQARVPPRRPLRGRAASG
jgi:hypothetical protein